MTHPHGCGLTTWGMRGSSEVLKRKNSPGPCSSLPSGQFLLRVLHVHLLFHAPSVSTQHVLKTCSAPGPGLGCGGANGRTESLPQSTSEPHGEAREQKAIAMCPDQRRNEGIFQVRLTHPGESRKLYRGGGIEGETCRMARAFTEGEGGTIARR